jgi:starch phosphorylase
MRLPEIKTAPAAEMEIPPELSRLYDLAYNLWWTWSPRAHLLFSTIDPAQWVRSHNPVEMLARFDPRRWDALLLNDAFLSSYHAVAGEFDRYLAEADRSWFRRTYPDFDGGPIAYLCTEFGWHESLGIYSGGLGVLAGDHSKSASDLGLPFVGVGLMYRRGYFRQTVDADGHQQHFYPDHDPARLPILPVTGPGGRELRVPVDLPGRRIHLRVFRATVGRVPVLLLDSDVRENDPADRPITSILYVSGREMRLCQEIVLGIGGVAVLRALGIQPSVWHENEGHSALAAFERIRLAMKTDGLSFPEAVRKVASTTVFTTHTPVPAGNEIFDLPLVRKYFDRWAEDAGLPASDLYALGRAQDGVDDGKFNLTALAIRTSAARNGVSRLHGTVANEMWKHLLAGRKPLSETVGYITNGVHLPSWGGPEMTGLLARHLGADLEEQLLDPELAARVLAIPDAEIWAAHVAQKRRLIRLCRERLLRQFARHGRSPDELRRVATLLDPDALTLGFARRFATYKRADLVFRDLDRLRRILCDAERPVQIVFAGKAHPADRPGQDLIRRIFEASVSPELFGKIVFLENYDLRVARFLVQGADVWLNTPERPLEASGTSGMKVSVNGGLNFSVLDGWWCEGFDPSHGWAIGDSEDLSPDAGRRAEDAAALYRTLEDEIVPCYYRRDDAGLPSEWILRMKRAIGKLTPRFSGSRMVREYVQKSYLPASRRDGSGMEIDEAQLWSP